MADFITPAILAVNIGCGLATNLSEAGGKGAYRRIAALLARGRVRENHDILKATHIAFVEAMETMAEAARRVTRYGPAADRAAAGALRVLCDDPAFRAFRYDGENFPLAEVNAAIDRMFAGGLEQAGGEALADSDLALNRLIVGDLRSWGVPLTSELEALFSTGDSDHPPWHVAFRAAFAHQVKTNGPAFRILTFERLGELRAIGLSLIAEVDGIHDRLDRIEAMLAELLRRVPPGAAAGLLGAVAAVFLTVQLEPLSRKEAPSIGPPTSSRPNLPAAPPDEGALPAPAPDGGGSQGETAPSPSPEPAPRPRSHRGEWMGRSGRYYYPPAGRYAAELVRRVRGRWGDASCERIYRIDTDGLSIEIVPPDGPDPLRLPDRARVVDTLRDALLVEPAGASSAGGLAVIEIVGTGDGERLRWWSSPEGRTAELRRCG